MATTKLWTVEALVRDGPSTGLWELIDGELVEMSPSGRASGKLAMWIGLLILGYVAPRRLGEALGPDTGFVLFPDRAIVRVPDVAFVRAERLGDQDESGFFHLAPDLAVEVRSPTDRLPDVLAKIGMELEAGVALVWLVDPPARTVAVSTAGQAVRVLGEGHALEGGDVLPGFRVEVAEIFQPL